MKDGQEEIVTPKVKEIDPRYTAQKCPVCNGFGTLKYGAKICQGCDGKGYVLVPNFDIDRKKDGKNEKTNKQIE